MNNLIKKFHYILAKARRKRGQELQRAQLEKIHLKNAFK